MYFATGKRGRYHCTCSRKQGIVLQKIFAVEFFTVPQTKSAKSNISTEGRAGESGNPYHPTNQHTYPVWACRLHVFLYDRASISDLKEKGIYLSKEAEAQHRLEKSMLADTLSKSFRDRPYR